MVSPRLSNFWHIIITFGNKTPTNISLGVIGSFCSLCDISYLTINWFLCLLKYVQNQVTNLPSNLQFRISPHLMVHFLYWNQVRYCTLSILSTIVLWLCSRTLYSTVQLYYTSFSKWEFTTKILKNYTYICMYVCMQVKVCTFVKHFL